jgi:uncharacterized protein YfaA (DUF2138 family)
MNWFFGLATIMVAAAAVVRLLWWAFGRSHQLASQGTSATGNPTELSQTGQGIDANGKVPVAVEAESRKK